jgi:hypothetical protein
MNKQLIAILIMDIPAIIFASVAGYMAVNNIDGYGWMILATVLCCVNNIKSGEDKNETRD